MMHKHNLRNPLAAVHENDVITAVNGLRGDAKAMLEEAKRRVRETSRLELEVERVAPRVWTVLVVRRQLDSPRLTGDTSGPPPLGLTIDTRNRVAKIAPGGQVDIFNQSSPATAVQIGDWILAVNGDAADIPARLTDGTNLELKLRRVW
jgi:hypothetical protein